MAWQQLKITALQTQAETISDWLSEQGALSVTFSDAEDLPIFEPKPNETPLWDNVLITALFTDDVDLQPILTQWQQQFPELSYHQEIVADQDWHKVWMDDYHPLRFGERLWICPSWCEPPDPQAVNIRLDPGMAFGTGTHETTALCLTWLDANPPKNKTILDYGCGSGILGLAALMLAAKHVWAVDHCEQALTATRNNMTNNDISPDCCETLLPEEVPSDLKVDIILANILATPLLELAERFSQHHVAGGALVLSGILREQVPQIIEKYKTWYDLAPVVYQNEWACVTGQRF